MQEQERGRTALGEARRLRFRDAPGRERNRRPARHRPQRRARPIDDGDGCEVGDVAPVPVSPETSETSGSRARHPHCTHASRPRPRLVAGDPGEPLEVAGGPRAAPPSACVPACRGAGFRPVSAATRLRKASEPEGRPIPSAARTQPVCRRRLRRRGGRRSGRRGAPRAARPERGRRCARRDAPAGSTSASAARARRAAL